MFVIIAAIKYIDVNSVLLVELFRAAKLISVWLDV